MGQESSNKAEHPLSSLTVTVQPDRLIRNLFFILLGFEILLVFLDVTVNYGRWTQIGAVRRLVNLTREDAIGNWFASTQTLFVGLTAMWVFIKAKKDRLSQQWGWLAVALFFIFMAFDDGTKFHERMGTAFKSLANHQIEETGDPPFEFFTYTWHLVLGPFFIGMGIFMFIFLWRVLSEKQLRIFFLAGLSCFTVAVGMDIVEGLEEGYDFLAEFFFWDPQAVRHFAKVTEEFIEMVGTTFFLICFLKHFMNISPMFTLRFEKNGPSIS